MDTLRCVVHHDKDSGREGARQGETTISFKRGEEAKNGKINELIPAFLTEQRTS